MATMSGTALPPLFTSAATMFVVVVWSSGLPDKYIAWPMTGRIFSGLLNDVV